MLATVTERSNGEYLVPIGEAARLLGVSVDTLRRWAREGRIPVITMPSGHRKFHREDIEALKKPGAA